MNRRAYLIENLRRYPRLQELHRSPFFAECGEEIRAILGTPHTYSHAGSVPRVHRFLRVVAWNIEKGKQSRKIGAVLQSHPVLRSADLVILNEVDFGMARSDNLEVARVLAQELGMNMVFGPAHIELTKGTDDDFAAPGENRESIQGNAVLTRHRVLETRIVALPPCFEPYEFHEKRFGTRSCVWARVAVGNATMWVGSLHLEVRNTPRCRALQMRHLLANLPGGASEGFLIGGDLNTSGFRRGTRWRTVHSVVRLMARSPAALRTFLCRPDWGSEPLFRAAKASGFEWEGLNSYEPTACTPIGSIEDASFLPTPAARFVKRRLAPYEGYLHFKLDWLLGKGVTPLRNAELRDPISAEASRDPGCIPTESIGPGRLSDHRPIYADLRVAIP